MLGMADPGNGGPWEWRPKTPRQCLSNCDPTDQKVSAKIYGEGHQTRSENIRQHCMVFAQAEPVLCLTFILGILYFSMKRYFLTPAQYTCRSSPHLRSLNKGKEGEEGPS